MYSKINIYTYKLLFVIFMYYTLTDYLSYKKFNYSKYKLLYHNSNKINESNKHQIKNKNDLDKNMKYVINVGGDTSSHSQNIVGAPVM